jgi:hypothetical protein
MIRRTFVIALAVMGFAAEAKEAKSAKPKKDGSEKTIAEFFAGPVRSFDIVLKPDAVEDIKRDARRYTEVQLVEGGVIHKHVALKLKGAASFRGLDDKPAMTLDFDTFKGADRFYGQKKFHLNNGMEDGSLLHEWLSGEVAKLCGVPAGRCGHALVKINGSDKGLYLIREGFTKDFLKRHFGNNDGAFFEGALQKEIGDKTEMSEGEEKDEKALEEMVAIAKSDAGDRWARLSAVLDVERYAAYLAAEHVLQFTDGYDFGINNYRIYRDEKSGKFCFILHGLDETWRSDEVSLQQAPGSVLGRAFWSAPEGRALYRAKISDFHERVLMKHDWPAKVLERNALIVAAMKAAGSKESTLKDVERRGREVADVVKRRIAEIGKQLSEWPEPMGFDKEGVAKLGKGWREENESGDAAELSHDAVDKQSALRISAKGSAVASWRVALPLEEGRYRFEANVRTRGVVPLEDDKGAGAGLRISGATERRTNSLTGDKGWVPLAYEFSLDSAREVTLVAELRATKGDAWFSLETLRLRKVR